MRTPAQGLWGEFGPNTTVRVLTLIWVLGFVGLLAAALVTYLLPGDQPQAVSWVDWEQRNLDRTTLWAQAVGGWVAVGVLAAAWRRVDAATDQAVAALRNAAAVERGNVTERFTRAIDQIGARQNSEPSIEIRVGGIYALEQIARDAADEYHPQVYDVLTAYVRQNAFIRTVRRTDQDPWEDEPTDTVVRDSREDRLREDIQAAIRAIARRDVSRDQVLEPLNLSHTNLDNAHLFRANLVGVNLIGASLNHANLGLAILRSSRLEGAQLRHAELGGANLTSAVLIEAQLTRVNLRGAILHSARFERAGLFRADLRDAVTLEGAQFGDADLRFANFEGANVAGANFSGANLRGARGITAEQLTAATIDESTKLPDGSRGRLGRPSPGE